MSEKDPSLEQIVDFLEKLSKDKTYKGDENKIKSLLYIVANHVEMAGSLKQVKMRLAAMGTPAKNNSTANQ